MRILWANMVAKYLDENMPLSDHLEELRIRLIRFIIISVFLAFLIFPFSGYFITSITEGLTKGYDINFIALNVIEGVKVQLQATIFLTMLFVIPSVGFYEFFMFVNPGLYPNERRLLLYTIPPAIFMFFSGVAVAYKLIIPVIVGFLIAYTKSTLNISLYLSIDQFLSFVFMLMIATGISFEFPVISAILCYLGIINPENLKKYRRHVYLALFIVAAIVTPDPTIVSMTVISIPMILIYELGIIASKMVVLLRK